MTNMKKLGKFEWVLIGVALILSVGISYYFFVVLPGGELGQGEKWRVLQELEAKHRGDSTASTPFISSASTELPYAALGLPTGKASSPYLWVLVDDQSDTRVMMIPKNGAFNLSCANTNILKKRVRLSPQVAKFLEQNCHEP
ncbi:hypothetical protein [Massilia pseudoviolaceinigra]|uniref:hypothetical protein n=1 Tax=Massilia pseudoviolaceinigra TaxID=3057165 RepID=UPI00279689A7|nr:hypothetical protein [Massilia sp. CCM 9206]MDQ1920564.1 hypothetical protein [Massilia sp. CCM 9206]